MRAVRERCVWSQRITHRDLVPYLIEESHEVIDAVESGTRADLREELGDLLWQVLFHAAIAAQDEDDPFDIDDVARTLTEKMVRRHPHVFGGETAATPEEVLVHWNAAKAAEKRTRRSVLDGVPRGMPALALAQKLVGRAAGAGVVASGDGRPQSSAAPATAPPGSAAPATAAPPTAASGSAAPGTEAELGDALLALVALARTNGWDAERALRERVRVLEDEVRAAEAD
ncbi:MazG nucleotide pyrophosphohydrolase domain-containing protein [Microbacterium sp. p3-SID336]|uniref:MazG nucleotide pyrophosphohydrolase domain-containing protein n=1 Tax=Microbacterium sp. p3-SID336 TaxID=2916212 RepID=UPI0021A297A3|nr:MazG nucleotide pyrophosphohydrolase domain-containing protein [Microbacterium sp. p3-SID336]MCT1479428.1 nucleoside triphosphate pyrophosphohydrolase [Microbacterium sp. p3-SID336]